VRSSQVGRFLDKGVLQILIRMRHSPFPLDGLFAHCGGQACTGVPSSKARERSGPTSAGHNSGPIVGSVRSVRQTEQMENLLQLRAHRDAELLAHWKAHLEPSVVQADELASLR
jgi:hypothetical protein